jgi:type IV pilus assembly protein PilA
MPQPRLSTDTNMTSWYYADNTRNRIGPLSADELREHYRQHRVRRDSLVWRDGMTKWQALASMAGELGLDAIAPDPSQPPPLPGSEPRPGFTPVRTMPKKQRMSGCLIALIICAALAVPVVGILAAIAIPAYNDYVQRAKVMEVLASATSLEHAIATHVDSESACPDNDSASIATPLQQLRQNPRVAAVRVGTLEGGHCAFEITLQAIGTQTNGSSVLFEASDEAAQSWTCNGGNLPDRYRPQQCRTNPNTTPT